MDERLKKALEFSNYMVTLNNQKKILIEQYYQNIIFYFAGGQFTVTQNLICFCATMLQKNQEDLVLIDDNKIPILIENLEKFYNDILDLYFNASNKFLNEYNLLKVKRSTGKLVGTDV